MNAASAQLRNPAITDTVNNGINEFIFVVRRGNYIVPPRAAALVPADRDLSPPLDAAAGAELERSSASRSSGSPCGPRHASPAPGRR